MRPARDPKTRVYLIGGGPGDPELVTRKAVRCLGLADLVLYDALVHPDLLEHCRPDAQREFVGKRAGRSHARQSQINARIIAAVREGNVVARLKGGDPYLFGRGSEEAEALAQAGIRFEVVPGVPSPSAATAYAGMSLTHRELASSVAYLTATESPEKDRSSHDWSKLATATQTLVIFMGLRNLASLMQLLIEHGRPASCPAAVIHAASTPQQRTVVGSVGDIADKVRREKLGMPALIVVGEIVTLREKLRWYDVQPLFARRVLVTRANLQAESLAQALRERGAQPTTLPMIRIDPPDDPSALRDAVTNLEQYAWLVLTSQNGVDAFFAELRRQGRDARRLHRARIAAIGPSTARALEPHGVHADVVPPAYRGERLAEALVAAHDGSLSGTRVLLPRAAVARDVLPETLRERGALVDVVEAYRTRGPGVEAQAELRRLLEAHELDVLTFTSSSTVEHTLSALGTDAQRLLANVTLASIGPITTDTASARGLHVHVTADTYTIEGLVDALERHFQETS
jgi:uroporphyrinogen III methyltransferase / synthase